MPATPKHEEYAARVVRFADLEDFISRAFDKKYDLRKGVGDKHLPGDPIAFDFRESAPSVPEIMEIEGWQRDGDDQPLAQVMLNNLVVRGELAYGIYMTTFPFPSVELW